MGSRFKIKIDFWFFVLIIAIALVGVFLVYPLWSLLITGFQDARTGDYTMANFERFFTTRFFYMTLRRSINVSVAATSFAVVVGVLMAYLTTVFQIRGNKVVNILIIISMLSPPFLGSYSWILMAGRAGFITQFFENNFGLTIPSIYGFGGIVLVMTLSGFPLIYLLARGALKKVDASVVEAAESLGCTPFRKAMTIIFPLVTPTLLAAAVLVFIDAFTDFGTPLLLGQGYMVMPLFIFNSFMGDMGGNQNFASAMALIMVIIITILFILQKYIVNRKSYSMNSLQPLQPTKLRGVKSIVAHGIVYLVTFVALLPQIVVIFTSFRATRGPVFVEGFSLDSYRGIFRTLGPAIRNTYLFGIYAIVIILVLGMLFAYLTVRKKNILTSVLDTVAMLPFVIPGSVIGIILILSFNSRPLLLIGTTQIMILAFVLRRLPFTLRSSSAILHQINPSVEEAAISLGDSPMKAFFKVTAIMMMPGVISGAILSWITIINELSSTILLFTTRTITMTVAIFQQIMRGGFGAAAALATILTVTTVVSLLVFFKITGKTDLSM
ncbi:MAG: iron ABC transporter permease [Defluviitaleaceae bacterium]|nr:iron ABC transporter permease [Defluviitaleaceae bacterium]